jgi:uncharacterized protein YcgI (DUF1989 family)
MAGTSGYQAKTKGGSPTGHDAAFYRALADARERRVVREDVIPARHGRGYVVEAGQLLRISCPEGSQVADMCVFAKEDPAEQFWSGRTRVVHGGHLNVGDHLWSRPPRSRPMMTIIADTVDHQPLPFGARSHDVLFCRCDARMYKRLYGLDNARNCNDNLAEAIAPFGLAATEVHDPFNVFMTTGINDQGRPFYLPSDSKKGDFVELYAEIACIVALSACPGGSAGPKSNPLGVTIFERST